MDRYPRLLIDTEKIRNNTSVIRDLAKGSGMSIFGVTKAASGDPIIGRAMLSGGALGLADSRIENIMKLKEKGIGSPMMLLRNPMITRVDDVVRYADISLNSEPNVLKVLSKAAVSRGITHKVVVMVEMGDLREGEMMEDTPSLLDLACELEHIELYGIGMNLACFAGVVPTREKIDLFEEFIYDQESRLGLEFDMVTGGNSGNIPLLIKEPKQGRIDNLRIGEGILLGLETVNREPIPNTFQDVFTVEAEIIEAKVKPSVPFGTVTQNAFGETPDFEDIGNIRRLVIALGRQDTILEGLTPEDPSLKMLGGSSDHMVIHDVERSYDVGDTVRFTPSYGALVSLYTSGYVNKVYLSSEKDQRYT